MLKDEAIIQTLKIPNIIWFKGRNGLEIQILFQPNIFENYGRELDISSVYIIFTHEVRS